MIALIHKLCRLGMVIQILSTVVATWEATLATGIIAFSIGCLLYISLEILKNFGVFQNG